eukprot:GHVP01037017.1.p1 GENE.GHVP01037017.1~~GHVP01037017.1.p1  ORF type:complete len:173 (-),score=28.71 GHVP01037017.1:1-519(-)
MVSSYLDHDTNPFCLLNYSKIENWKQKLTSDVTNRKNLVYIATSRGIVLDGRDGLYKGDKSESIGVAAGHNIEIIRHFQYLGSKFLIFYSNLPSGRPKYAEEENLEKVLDLMIPLHPVETQSPFDFKKITLKNIDDAAFEIYTKKNNHYARKMDKPHIIWKIDEKYQTILCK